MKIDQLREKTVQELDKELLELKEELFKLRFQHATRQLENPVAIRNVKRQIARVHTVITEKNNDK